MLNISSCLGATIGIILKLSLQTSFVSHYNLYNWNLLFLRHLFTKTIRLLMSSDMFCAFLRCRDCLAFCYMVVSSLMFVSYDPVSYSRLHPSMMLFLVLKKKKHILTLLLKLIVTSHNHSDNNFKKKTQFSINNTK